MKDFLVWSHTKPNLPTTVPQWAFDVISSMSMDLDCESKDGHGHSIDITVLPEHLKMCKFYGKHTSIWADYSDFPADCIYFSQFHKTALVTGDVCVYDTNDYFTAHIEVIDFEDDELKKLLYGTGFWYWEGMNLLIHCTEKHINIYNQPNI